MLQTSSLEITAQNHIISIYINYKARSYLKIRRLKFQFRPVTRFVS